MRFDDRPDVFEITADTSHDVTLTSEAGAAEESSAWETSGPSLLQSPVGVEQGLGSTQMLGQRRAADAGEIRGQSLAQDQEKYGGQAPDQSSRLRYGQNSEQNPVGPSRGQTPAQVSAHRPAQRPDHTASHDPAHSRSTSPPLPAHRLNRAADPTTASAHSSSPTPGPDAGPGSARGSAAAAEAEESAPRGRRAAAPEPFLFDRDGLERQRAALERELDTFRAENALLSKLKAEVQQQRLAMEAQRQEWETWKREEREKAMRKVEDGRRRLAEDRAKFEAEKRKHAEEWRKRETPELRVLNNKVSVILTEMATAHLPRPGV